MTKPLTLDDFGPTLEELSEQEDDDFNDRKESLPSSFTQQLLDIINKDNVSILLSYKEARLDVKDSIDYLYIKPSQVEQFIDRLTNAQTDDWIIIRDDEGNATSMLKNTPSLAVVRFVTFKK